MLHRLGRRAGLTLVELLVVMGIIAVLATLTALYFPRFQDGEMVSRGADQLQGLLLIARQQARRDGLPTGVRLVQSDPPPPATAPPPGIYDRMELIQQPADFAQGTYQSFTPGNATTGQVASFQLPAGVAFNQGVPLAGSTEAIRILPGDYLVVFDNIARQIRPDISTSVGSNTLELRRPFTNNDPANHPLPTPPAGVTGTNYRIILQPRQLSGEQARDLPYHVGIDMNYHAVVAPPPVSPATTAPPLSRQGGSPIKNRNIDPNNPTRLVYEVLFSPSGTVVGTSGNAPIIFWVRDYTRDNSVDFRAGNATLIVIHPRTGFIAAHPVANSASDPYLFVKDGRASGM